MSVLVETQEEPIVHAEYNAGIGIDVGIKSLVTTSNGDTFKNINKTSSVKKLEKQLARQQRKLSRKYEDLKNRGKEATRKNIDKQLLKVQKLYKRISNIRHNHVNQTISALVKAKPMYVVFEDLSVSNMMKNRHLSKAISALNLYTFKSKLITKCKWNSIEVRQVDRFYPSSKTCHNCGYVKSDLKLSERTFVCPVCGHTLDRDLNAALNLRDATSYKVI